MAKELRTGSVRAVLRAVMVGFASLFSFGETDRHFAEPPAVLQPAIEEHTESGEGEPV